MLIKLSGNVYINPDNITFIRPRETSDGKWVVFTTGEDTQLLNQEQMDELTASTDKTAEIIETLRFYLTSKTGSDEVVSAYYRLCELMGVDPKGADDDV